MTRGPTRGRRYDERNRPLSDAEIARFLSARRAERDEHRREQTRRAAARQAKEVGAGDQPEQ